MAASAVVPEILQNNARMPRPKHKRLIMLFICVSSAPLFLVIMVFTGANLKNFMHKTGV